MTSATASKFTVIPVPALRRRGRRRRSRPAPTRVRSSPAPRTARSSGSARTGRRSTGSRKTGGRPLGLEIGPDGRLLVCDSHRGAAVGRHRVRSGRGDHRQPRRRADALLQQRRDRERRHGVVLGLLDPVRTSTKWKDDFVQNTRTGRLARLDTDGSVEVVLDGLAFANGVALSKDEDFVCVAETGGPDRRPPLADRQPGRHARPAVPEPARLPGQHRARERRPDLGDPRAAPPTRWSSACRRARCRCGRWSRRSPRPSSPSRSRPCGCRPTTTRARWCTTSTCNPKEHGAAFHMVTGVREHDGRVWMGSLHEPAVAVYDALTP